MTQEFLRNEETITVRKEGERKPCLILDTSANTFTGVHRERIIKIPLTTLGDNLMVGLSGVSSIVLGCEVNPDGETASYTTRSGSIYRIKYHGFNLFEAKRRARIILYGE